MAAREGAAVGAGIGALVSAGTLVWSTRRARSLEVSDTEERIFRAINDRSDTLHPAVWLVMRHVMPD